MPLRTFVIVSPVTNLSDARYCAGMGADVLGFTLEPGQETTIPQSTFKELTGWVAGVKLLGEFTGFTPTEINQIAEDNHLDFVLLNRLYSLADVEKIERPVILRIKISEDDTLASVRDLMESYFPEIEFFLIDAGVAYSTDPETQLILRDLAMIFPVVLGAGVNAENALQLLEKIKPAGICLQGGAEIKPGVRNFEELGDILELLQPEED